MITHVDAWVRMIYLDYLDLRVNYKDYKACFQNSS